MRSCSGAHRANMFTPKYMGKHGQKLINAFFIYWMKNEPSGNCWLWFNVSWMACPPLPPSLPITAVAGHICSHSLWWNNYKISIKHSQKFHRHLHCGCVSVQPAVLLNLPTCLTCVWPWVRRLAIGDLQNAQQKRAEEEAKEEEEKQQQQIQFKDSTYMNLYPLYSSNHVQRRFQWLQIAKRERDRKREIEREGE